MRPPNALVPTLAYLLGALAFIGNTLAQTITAPPPTPSTIPWGTLGPCPTGTEHYDCFIYGPTPDIWGWATVFSHNSTGADGLLLPTFTAFTVVTVYNTVASTSRVTTIFNDQFPANATVPKVNSDGTRVEIITYTRFGTASTATVTYPTPFFDWPDWYGVGGAYTITHTIGNATSTECIAGDPLTGYAQVITNAETPMYLTDNPQPTDALFYSNSWKYNLTEDPFGLNYAMAPDRGSDHFPYVYYHETFEPNEYEHPFNICDIWGFGPRLGQFYSSTAWFIGTGTSTSFEGDVETETTSREGTTSSTSEPTTTSSEGDDETTTTPGPIASTATSTTALTPTSTPGDEGSSTSARTQGPDTPQSTTSSSSSTGQDPGPDPGPGSSTGASVPVTTIVSTAADGAVVTLTVPASSPSVTTVVSTASDGALVTLTVPVSVDTQSSVSLTPFVSTANDGAVVTLYIPVSPTGDEEGSAETDGSGALPSHPVAAGSSMRDQRGLAMVFSVVVGVFFGAWYM